MNPSSILSLRPSLTGAASSTRPAAASSASRWARLWAADGKIAGRAHRAAFPAQGEVGHLPVHVRRRQPHRHLRPEGQQVGRQADRRDRLRRQRGRDEAAGDPCLRTFTRYGKSGIPVSDWFPHVGGVIDEIAVVRSMWCHEGNHFPAVIETCTGHRGRAVRPPDVRELGLLRAGQRQQEPADVREHRPAVLAGAVDRRLPRRERRPPRRSSRARRRSRTCIRRKAATPPSANGRCRRSTRLNREFRETLRHQLRHRRRASQAYELAARMQLSAPGGGRFLERAGARPGPLRHRREGDRRLRPAAAAGAPAGGERRPLHPDLPRRRRQRRLGRARRHQDPRAALPRDRQADRRPDPRPEAARACSTRRWWCWRASSAAARGRRTPPAATTTRRATRSWLAGGGVKGGIVHGATDDVGYKAVENRHYYSDLHATILHQLGLDYKKMEIPVLGRTFHLVEEGDGPIQAILA